MDLRYSKYLLGLLARTLELWKGDPPDTWLQHLRDMVTRTPTGSSRCGLLRVRGDGRLDLAFNEACDWYQGALASLLAVAEGYVEEAETVRLSLAKADAALLRVEKLALPVAA